MKKWKLALYVTAQSKDEIETAARECWGESFFHDIQEITDEDYAAAEEFMSLDSRDRPGSDNDI